MGARRSQCLSWLEALGFCGIGEGADFVSGGRSITGDGGAAGRPPPVVVARVAGWQRPSRLARGQDRR